MIVTPDYVHTHADYVYLWHYIFQLRSQLRHVPSGRVIGELVLAKFNRIPTPGKLEWLKVNIENNIPGLSITISWKWDWDSLEQIVDLIAQDMAIAYS